ncbi:MAG TPA: pseudouridine synthase [Acidimicrobiales bacterium]|nr:pseudouridine synthase [Acidimicrobiales bacterium]
MPEGNPADNETVEPDGAAPRLQKVLARVGLGSRRACEELIADGRVVVNGERAILGQRVDPTRDRVELDGVALPLLPGLVHYVLNKPVGVLTTADDPHGRPTVVSLVPNEPRVFPVGRLDADSEGLLIMTNDGDLAQRLTHPSFGVEKEYLAEVEGVPSAGALRTLRQGVELEDGMTAPATVGVVGPGVLRIVIHEGRNRQIRRMAEAVGHPVRRLVRTRIGTLCESDLGPGQWRPLSLTEVRDLASSAGPRPGPGARPAKGDARRDRKGDVKRHTKGHAKGDRKGDAKRDGPGKRGRTGGSGRGGR